MFIPTFKVIFTPEASIDMATNNVVHGWLISRISGGTVALNLFFFHRILAWGLLLPCIQQSVVLLLLYKSQRSWGGKKSSLFILFLILCILMKNRMMKKYSFKNDSKFVGFAVMIMKKLGPFRPVYVLLSRFRPDFIQILSKFFQKLG